MTEPDTIQLLVQLLADRDPFLHVRFGDGDVFFATGTGPVLTGDGETWSPELAAELRAAWQSLARYPGRLLVGDVESYAVSDGCEPQWRSLLQEAEQLRGAPLELVHMEALRVSFGNALPFYRAVANDPRRKVYVAPERLAGAADLLDAEHVVVPLHVAHETAHETAGAVVRHVEEQGAEVVIFSAGRGGKIVQGMLAEVYPDGLTQIDVGSGLDVLFTDLRRGTDRGADVTALQRTYRRAGLAGMT